jgi:hypothetical protein
METRKMPMSSTEGEDTTKKRLLDKAEELFAVSRLVGRRYDPAFKAQLVDHITEFSLRGLGESENKEAIQMLSHILLPRRS